MQKKPVFNPEITRIKLNPEQAVLACACYSNSTYYTRGARSTGGTVCIRNSRSYAACKQQNAANASIS